MACITVERCGECGMVGALYRRPDSLLEYHTSTLVSRPPLPLEDAPSDTVPISVRRWPWPQETRVVPEGPRTERPLCEASASPRPYHRDRAMKRTAPRNCCSPSRGASVRTHSRSPRISRLAVSTSGWRVPPAGSVRASGPLVTSSSCLRKHVVSYDGGGLGCGREPRTDHGATRRSGLP